MLEGPELRFRLCNAYYRKLIGDRNPEGSRMLDLWPELEGSPVHLVLQRVLETGEVASETDFRIVFDQRGTGEQVEAYFDFVYQPQRDGDGHVTSIVAVGVDVTAQVSARREGDRLRQAAEDANDAKLHLLRTVSHETRQPVHASLGYLDLLALPGHGGLTDKQRVYVESIRKNQSHLLGLLNDILSFAKIEAGALDLEIERVLVADLFDSLAALIEPQFQAKSVAFEAVPPPTAVAFMGDRERSIQVCINLLTNAIKATPAGGRVRLKCELDTSAITIVVEDTGSGIPVDKREIIFDPFKQLARTRAASQAGGVGLGLSISRQLARAMNGDVTVESELGAGSVFRFVLPRA
jgi:signal transduction histidine kinase